MLIRRKILDPQYHFGYQREDFDLTLQQQKQSRTSQNVDLLNLN